MNTDWFLIPFIVNLALIAYITVNYRDYIKQVLISTFEYNTSAGLYNESKNNKPKSAHLLFVIFLVSGMIFTLQLSQKFLPELSKTYFFWIPGITVILIFLLTFLNKFSNYITGKIFMTEEISKEYNHNITVFNQSFGIILFPVTVLISFTEAPNVFIYIGIVLLSLIYLLRIIRFIKINFNKQINILYMFLYLCTLEIIPILYITKLIVVI